MLACSMALHGIFLYLNLTFGTENMKLCVTYFIESFSVLGFKAHTRAGTRAGSH